MKYIYFFVKLIAFVVLVALCVYLEDYVQRFSCMAISMLVILIGVVISREKYCMVGLVLFCVSLCTAGIGVHIEEVDGSIIVKSPFYTHILERGSHVEKNELRTYYSKYYSRVDVEKEHFYFLYHETGSISIYNTYKKVIEVDTTFEIKSKDWGDGVLDYINYRGVNYDLQGTKITDGYKPFKYDGTPEYNTANW